MDKGEALAYINLNCIRLACREDFPRNRSGYLEHIASRFATNGVREDAYKMAVRGLEDTDEAKDLRQSIDQYNAAQEEATPAAALGRKGGSVRSPRKAAAVRANGRKGGRPRTPAAQ